MTNTANMTNTAGAASTASAAGTAGAADKATVTRSAKGGPMSSVREWWRARRRALRADAGMTTSEYAVGTIAAAAFAAVLYKIVTSGTVSGALESMIGKALDAPF
ncbi:DUF4244 domain-containing protein [Streptomyces gardneri]|uniref:DUF4244 domain-containing protein n=1 Tax=Streptomyces gardneri TaxID=66892 RepID=UPI0035E1A23A